MTFDHFSLLYKEIFTECKLERFVGEEFATKFYTLYTMLVDFNSKTNITAITEPREVMLKHFADSLMIEQLIPKGSKLLDVGCGGGFPTLPLCAVRQDLEITALDSTAKKLEFVKTAAEAIRHPIKTVAGRAEELGKLPQFREQYDVVTARAVANLPVLSEWCIPFVKVGGVFIAMKGQSGKEELDVAQNAVFLLGCKCEETTEMPLENAVRVNITIRKTTSTPKIYPRTNSAIKKKPL